MFASSSQAKGGAEWIVNPLASEDEGKYNVEYRPFLMSPQLMP